MTYIYEWTEPDCDEHGLEVRPPNAMGATGPAKEHPLKNKPKKGYDRSAVIEDLRAELMTADDIAMKYDISPQTIYTIIRREGLTSIATRKDLGKPRKQYDREALVEDIKANLLTYAELGKKYDLRPISIQRIARVEGLTKPRKTKQ
jgi:transposase